MCNGTIIKGHTYDLKERSVELKDCFQNLCILTAYTFELVKVKNAVKFTNNLPANIIYFEIFHKDIIALSHLSPSLQHFLTAF